MDHLTRLLLAAQGGDRAALDAFVRETFHDVTVLCRHLGDPDSADDLVQESYQRAFMSLHRFRASGPARHWLLTIARRTCADATRRRTRRRRLGRRLDELGGTDVEHLPIDSTRVEIDEWLRLLDEDRRAAFVLTQLNGLRYDEAAEVLEVPIGTIRSRVSRAREQLVDLVRTAEAGEVSGAGREPERIRRRP